MPRLVVLVTACALATFPARSLADDVRLDEAITVAGDDACVTHAALAEQVAVWLERDAIAPSLRIAVTIEHAAIVIAITQAGAPVGRRSFDTLPSRCAERLAAVGLGIALAIDAALLESLVPQRPPESPPSEPPPAESPASEEAPAEPGAPSALAVSLEVEGLLLLEILPEIAAAGAASVGLRLAPGVRVRAGFLATQETSTRVGRGRAAVALIEGRLDGCLATEIVASLELGGCASVLAGAALARGEGFAVNRTREALSILFALRAELRWMPARWIALGVAVDGLAALVRPELQVRDDAGGLVAAQTTAPAGAAGAVTMGIVIP